MVQYFPTICPTVHLLNNNAPPLCGAYMATMIPKLLKPILSIPQHQPPPKFTQYPTTLLGTNASQTY